MVILRSANNIISLLKKKATSMLKLSRNRYDLLKAMKELLVNANLDIIDYSRQNIYPLYL